MSVVGTLIAIAAGAAWGLVMQRYEGRFKLLVLITGLIVIAYALMLSHP